MRPFDPDSKTERSQKFGAWAHWVAAAISACSTLTPPKEFRDHLVKEMRSRRRFAPSDSVLVIAFGSVARLEPFRDLDLIIIDGTWQGPDHEYHRIAEGELNLDLNIAGPEWLRNAWKDIEWGYWLAESYPLDVSHAHLVNGWRHAANLYWSVAGIRRRSLDHIRLVRTLVSGTRDARAAGLPLLARLLAHEAGRAFACGLIDHYGDRVFSHRSLHAEFGVAARRAGVAHSLPANLDAVLGWDRENANEEYLSIRATLSSFLRGPCCLLFPDMDTSRPRTVRVAALAALPRNPSGRPFENCLEGASASRWLPRECDFDISSAVLDAFHPTPNPVDRPTHRQSRAAPPEIIPIAGHVAGARWVEMIGTRLKLIANTGGCKTPSCRFCTLPKYGRALPRADLAETLEQALQLPELGELSLYNDGNLLNVREVSHEELLRACDIIRAHRIHTLAIETTPRFVTADCVREIRQRSGVSRLSVAMGLQSVGNFFAVRTLGRPDVDALFDYAIDQIHESEAEVRLYLLWGFGPHSIECWEERLVASVDWARVRSVERVSVCPYRPTVLSPSQCPGAGSEQILAGLVDGMQGISNTLIDIVGEGMASCTSKPGVFALESGNTPHVVE